MSALVYAVSALVRAHRDRAEAAREDRVRASQLLTKLVDGPPWYGVETRVALARAALRLGDVIGTRSLLAEAARLRTVAVDAPLASVWIEDCRAHADAFCVSSPAGPSSLTPAELRVVRLLPTHLSFREIGEQLFVSRNTIKTQAISVYRKLGVSSRSDAIARAVELGLVEVSVGGPSRQPADLQSAVS